jgi:hypothetical protein
VNNMRKTGDPTKRIFSGRANTRSRPIFPKKDNFQKSCFRFIILKMAFFELPIIV